MSSNHNQLDQHFAQEAQNYNFEYNPDAWAAMEVLLNKKKKKKALLWLWFVLPGLLAIGFMSYFLLPNANLSSNRTLKNQTKTEHHKQKTSQIKEQKSQNEQTSNEVLKKHRIIDPQEIQKASIQSKTKPIERDVRISSKKMKASLNEKPRNNFESISLKSESTSLKESSILLGNDNSFVKKDPNTQNKNERTRSKDTTFKERVDSILRLMQDTLLKPDSLPTKNPTSRRFYAKDTGTSNRPTQYIDFIIGAEFASPQLSQFNKVGYKVGLTYNIHVKPRIRLTTGLAFSRKSYSAKMGEFTPPKGFWNNGVSPIQTNGFCNIIEIPLLVGYHFYPKWASGWYLEGGVNSYVMLKESYIYTYANPNPALRQQWETNNANDHLFGILQFGLGYEKKMRNMNSISISPYLQVPLTGIGKGNVPLYSLGTTLSYTLN